MDDNLASESLVAKSKSACMKDGMASFSAAGMGESYVVPAAIALGAAGPVVLLLSSLPRFIGSILQILFSPFLCTIKSKKMFVVVAVLGQAFVWLAISFLLFFFFGWEYAVAELFFMFCLYFFFGFSASPAWASWVSEFIHEKERGSFFANRNRISTLFMVGALVLGAGILQFFGSNAALAFAIVFSLAAVFRLISSKFLYDMAEFSHTPQCSCGHAQILGIFKNKTGGEERLFLFYICSIMAATYIAAPIFDLYMLTTLGFSYITWAMIKFAGIVSKPLFLPYWGKIMDEYGVRPTLYACGILIPLVPILWVFTTDPLVIFLIEIIAGMTWGGFELAAFGATISFGDSDRRAIMTSAYNLVYSIGLLAGALTGAALLAIWPQNAMPAFIGLLLISAVCRILANLAFLPKFRKGFFSNVSTYHILWQVTLVMPVREGRSFANYFVCTLDNVVKKVKKAVMPREPHF